MDSAYPQGALTCFELGWIPDAAPVRARRGPKTTAHVTRFAGSGTDADLSAEDVAHLDSLVVFHVVTLIAVVLAIRTLAARIEG